MWYSHFVILAERPSQNALARVRDGYQLWRDSVTGLHFLSAHSTPLGKRPDFAQSLDRRIRHKVNVSFLKEFEKNPPDEIEIMSGQISYELIQQTATLSHELEMAVLAAEDTDDFFGMAVCVESERITYLRFKVEWAQHVDADLGIEVVYTPGDGFTLDRAPAEDNYGAAQKAIAEVMGVQGIDLYDYADEKPTREQAKERVSGTKTSIKAYLDGFGAFKRLSYAEPQLTAFEKFRNHALGILEWPLKILFLTIYLPGIFVAEFINSIRGKVSDPSGWLLAVYGVGCLIPLALILGWIVQFAIGFVEAMLGF